MKFVSIIMGSKSDYEVMKECANTLQKFGVPYELIISSAHRSPERTKQYIQSAEKRVLKFLLRQLEWQHTLSWSCCCSYNKAGSWCANG